MKTLLRIIGYIVGIIVILLLAGFVFGPRTANVFIETEIDAPAEDVWAVLAHDFAEMDKWTTTLSLSRAVDADELPDGLVPAPGAPVLGRVTTSPVLTAYEIITEYDEDGMILKFDAGNLPAFLSSAQNTQSVVDLGNGKSKIVFDAQLALAPYLRLLNPIFGSRFSNTMLNLQDELKVYVETGAPRE